MSAAVSFTPAGYRALLDSLCARGYEVRDFFSARPERRHLILRHDVDVSLEAALEMAAFEAGLGVRSSYFVLLRSELYNPFAPPGQAALRLIRALGHEVGLHFDAALVEGGLDALDAAAANECALLEGLLGTSVRMISFHRPAKVLLGLDRPLAGRAHAYEPRFFSSIGYCSDSRGAFRHGEPLAQPAVAAGTAMQLLTHPIWWMGEAEADVTARLERFIAARADAMREALAATIQSYAPERGTGA
ncbi:MAG: hypothetical protein AB7P52_08640 [Alphaproteobacteria bacterium]